MINLQQKKWKAVFWRVSEFLRLSPYFQNDSMGAVLRPTITTDIRNILQGIYKTYPFILVEIVNYRVKHVTDGELISQSHCWLQARKTNISRILLIFKSFQDMRFIEPCWDKWCFVVGFGFVNYTMTASCKFLIYGIFWCIWHTIFKNIFAQLHNDF